MAQRGRKPQPKPSKTGPGICPDRPDWIESDEAVEFWDQFAGSLNALGLLESLDAPAFGMLASAFAAWRQIKAEAAKSPHTNIVGENGAVQVDPIHQLAAQQTKAVLTLLSEFGMTPVSRTKLTGSTSASPANPLADPMAALFDEVTAAKTPKPTTPATRQTKKTKRKPTKRKSQRE